jgi:hypothetical protein
MRIPVLFERKTNIALSVVGLYGAMAPKTNCADYNDPLPDHTRDHLKANHVHKGIYALEDEAKAWIMEELNAM